MTQFPYAAQAWAGDCRTVVMSRRNIETRNFRCGSHPNQIARQERGVRRGRNSNPNPNQMARRERGRKVWLVLQDHESCERNAHRESKFRSAPRKRSNSSTNSSPLLGTTPSRSPHLTSTGVPSKQRQPGLRSNGRKNICTVATRKGRKPNC